MHCRFYEKKFPEVDDIVMCEVTRVEPTTGAYVALLEYGNLEGMIMASECSRKRIKTVAQLLKVGKREPLLVTKVDEVEGFIDLSRKRVLLDDIKQCEDRYNNAKKIQVIAKNAAVTLGQELEEMYTKVFWPLDAAYPSAYNAARISLEHPEEVFSKVDISPEWVAAIKEAICSRMKPPEVKIHATFEITCYSEEGIEGIKEVLINARNKANADNKNTQIAMRMISSPLYEVSTKTTAKSSGIAFVKACLQRIQDEIESKDGSNYIFRVKEEPIVLGAEKEEDIESIIKKMQEHEDESTTSQGDENEEGMRFEGDEDEEEKRADFE